MTSQVRTLILNASNSSGGKGVLAPFVRSTKKKKNARFHAAEKIDILCKIAVQHKKKTSDHEVCHLFADLSVCLINYDKKRSQVHFIMQKCVIKLRLEEGGVFCQDKRCCV